jgi:hypothetical protein
METKFADKTETYPTGAKRGDRKGKGRYDLLPMEMLKRDAALYEKGAEHYGGNNYRKGFPLSSPLDSALRHLVQLLNNERDEDHAAAVRFNVAVYEWTRAEIEAGRLPRSLDDVGHTKSSAPVAKINSVLSWQHGQPIKVSMPEIEDIFFGKAGSK